MNRHAPRGALIAGGWRAGLLGLALVFVTGVVSLVTVGPPDPVPASAPEERFSAERAFAHVRAIGDTPHPSGTAANQRVREYVLSRLRELGLRVRVQETVGRDPSPGARGTLATVHNVVAVLPGRAPTGRVFLVAHYDSVATGPGANDDGAGTATLLETARALTALPRPRNDIVLVLTDVEEGCLCGAEAFARSSPLARDGGVVLNLEARGSSGPVVMFETSARNSWLIDVFAGAAPQPLATSFAVNVYRLLPRDTDFTAFLRAAGFTGLNSAYFDGSVVYHTPLDTPPSMSRASLQHHGSNTLALARGFASADLDRAGTGHRATFFPVAGSLAHYPSALNWPLAVLAALAVLGLALLARRRELASLPRVLAGFGLALLSVLLAGIAAALLWRGVVAAWPQYAAYGTGDPYHPVPLRLAVLALSAAVLLGWYPLARRIGPAALAIGALGVLALTGLATAALVPGGSYLWALPALVTALAGMVALTWRRGPYGGAALTVAGAVAALLYVPTVPLLFAALGLGSAGVVAAYTALCLLPLLPLLELVLPTRRRARRAWRPSSVPAVAIVATFALLAGGLWANRVSDNRPRPAHLLYTVDSGTGTAHWLSGENDPSEWTADYLSDPAGVPRDFPMLAESTLRAGRAPAAELPAPEVAVLDQRITGERRTLRLLLRSNRDARVLGLYLPRGVDVLRAVVRGRDLPVAGPAGTADAWGFGFTYIDPPEQGVELSLTVPAGQPLRLRVIDRTEGLDALPGFTPRPPHLTKAPGHRTDVVLAGRTYTVSEPE